MESENGNYTKEEAVPEQPVSDQPNLEALLSQVDKLESELEAEQRKSSDQLNRIKYLQADLINMQRQADRMISESKIKVKLDWILEIISIKEDLDRALKSASSEKSALVDGLRLLSSRIENDLKAEQVKQIKIDSDTKFDPRYHEAVASRETDDKPEGTILSIVANGYTIDGKVIKPALIEVARRKPESAPKEQAPQVPENESPEK